jgi:hypothetical protein
MIEKYDTNNFNMNFKTSFLLFLIIFYTSSVFAQKRGVNNDPFQIKVGEKPYEMVGRAEDNIPVATFEDCTKWIVETENCKANLYRTEEEKLFREYSGKLVFTPTAKESEITLRLEKPVLLNDDWDCIDFWNWGAHWLWGEPAWQTAFRGYALIEDAGGEIQELSFTQSGYPGMVHKYWFLNHIKLNGEIKLPAKFIGVKFKTFRAIAGEEQKFYLGPISVYKEKLAELKFEKWPEKLPFPLRKETILPTNKTTDFQNTISKKGGDFEFTYNGSDTKLTFVLKPEEGVLNGIYLKRNGKEIPLNRNGGIQFQNEEEAKWQVERAEIVTDTLFINSTAQLDSKNIHFRFWYTINQKSLIVGIFEDEKTGSVAQIGLGETAVASDAKLVNVPFLTYGENRVPNILYSGGLFFFKQFDWYYSDASDFLRGRNQINNGGAIYNSGVRYIPKTNGVRNPVREKLFITVSPDVQEVLPTIDNPKSPMKSVMADRLWMIEGSPDHEYLKNQANKLRALGLEKVAVRYHEGIWRDGGESYTFRTETAPGRGGNEAVKKLVKYIKDKDWLVGLYSNYTDFAPVNKNWNPDWVKRGPKGEWKVSWSRCYAPKPMIAVEQERKFAPVIHNEFGTNFSYCDVHTAVSPIARVDYDARVPGAATFRRTYECYGLLLINETRAYHGPVYSEGNYHWWYAGLVDGNYGNANPKLDKTAVFPDFQLLKIHPLEMDAGNVYKNGAEYLAYTLAYGHIGILNGETDERIKRYAMLQPLQKYYSMVPVKSISYFDDGEYYNSSQAVIKDLIAAPKLALEYESGLKVYINFSDKNWTLNSMDNDYILPKFGFLAVHEKDSLILFSGYLNGSKSRVDFISGENHFYIDSYGADFKTGNFSCNGKVFVKKEKFGWEIIPATDFESFGFKLSALGIQSEKIEIEGVDSNDLPIEQVVFVIEDDKIVIEHKNKAVLKYRISEVQ